jgi:uncharacterized protein YjbI with pentapeptide repeats
MANKEHFDILCKGVNYWNKWREQNPIIRPDFKGRNQGSMWNIVLQSMVNVLRESTSDEVDDEELANIAQEMLKGMRIEYNAKSAMIEDFEKEDGDFYEIDFNKADFRNANFSNARFNGANLIEVDFSECDLRSANFSEAILTEAKFISSNCYQASFVGSEVSKAVFNGANLEWTGLQRANFRGAQFVNANLRGANLGNSDFSHANLKNAILEYSILIKTNLINTTLNECSIYGIAAWDVETDQTTNQSDLIITDAEQSTVTVDNIEVAQFIYLLLNNKKIRQIINTVTSKVVLILGRFTEERKPILNSIKDELRKYNYTPVLFDFDKPDDRNFIETVSTLAHLAKFIVADFTAPKIVLQEAQHIVSNIAIPFAPIFLKDSGFEPITLYDLRKGRYTVLDTFCYLNEQHLIENLNDKVIVPAAKLAEELNKRNPIN